LTALAQDAVVSGSTPVPPRWTTPTIVVAHPVPHFFLLTAASVCRRSRLLSPLGFIATLICLPPLCLRSKQLRKHICCWRRSASWSWQNGRGYPGSPLLIVNIPGRRLSGSIVLRCGSDSLLRPRILFPGQETSIQPLSLKSFASTVSFPAGAAEERRLRSHLSPPLVVP
jgi:hypothetical protein